MQRTSLALLLVAIACESATATTIADLEREQQRWKAAGLRNYDFQYGVETEWGEYTGPYWIVKVRDGVVSTVTDLAGKPVDYSNWIPKAPTIDSLFAHALTFDAPDADVEFRLNTLMHYPAMVRLDRTGTADDQVIFYAEKLVRR